MRKQEGAGVGASYEARVHVQAKSLEFFRGRAFGSYCEWSYGTIACEGGCRVYCTQTCREELPRGRWIPSLPNSRGKQSRKELGCGTFLRGAANSQSLSAMLVELLMVCFDVPMSNTQPKLASTNEGAPSVIEIGGKNLDDFCIRNPRLKGQKCKAVSSMAAEKPCHHRSMLG